MEASTGLVAVWQQGDAVTRAIVLLLLLMSLSTWLVLLHKTMQLLRIRQWAARVDAFWNAADPGSDPATLGTEPDNPFRRLADQAAWAVRHHGATASQLQDRLNLSDWLQRSLRAGVDDTTTRLQAGLAVLASVGSTAPFVGLFGTVWGIYHALVGIGAAGQATIDQVAGPIGEALIMTALGLAVAIPAVLGYNALVRGNKAVIARLNRLAYDLHAYWVTGARVPRAGNGATRDA